ncbi:unnamed protein product [Sphacelaria rigidula]
MVQCEADPCVFRMEDAGDVHVILVVHVDDILISGTEENVGKVGEILNKNIPTNNLGEATWYMGCAVYRDWDRGTLSVTQTTFTDTLLKRFEVRGYSEIPASVSANLGPTTGEDTVVNRPYRNAVGGLMWLATITGPDIANSVRALARQSHDPCERHWEAVVKVLKYLNETKEFGLTFKKGNGWAFGLRGSRNVRWCGSVGNEPHATLCDSVNYGGRVCRNGRGGKGGTVCKGSADVPAISDCVGMQKIPSVPKGVSTST